MRQYHNALVVRLQLPPIQHGEYASTYAYVRPCTARCYRCGPQFMIARGPTHCMHAAAVCPALTDNCSSYVGLHACRLSNLNMSIVFCRFIDVDVHVLSQA